MQIIDQRNQPCQFKVAIVVTRYNEELSKLLCDGAIGRLRELNFQDHQISVVWVPSALDIPLAAQYLSASGQYEAVICLGAIIRGETDFYDHLSEQVFRGCQRVVLDHSIPVVFGVLLADTEAQARSRSGGVHGHKGREVVNTAVEMVSVLRALDL